MIYTYYLRCQKKPQVYFFNQTSINVEIKKKHKSLFGRTKFQISVIVNLDKRKIQAITDILDFLIDEIAEDPIEREKTIIFANWHIFCDNIDRELFDFINQKENRKYPNMKNAFALIDNISGEVIFLPDKIQNKVISQRMIFLTGEARKKFASDEEKEKSMLVEIGHFYQILEVLLRDINSGRLLFGK